MTNKLTLSPVVMMLTLIFSAGQQAQAEELLNTKQETNSNHKTQNRQPRPMEQQAFINPDTGKLSSAPAPGQLEAIEGDLIEPNFDNVEIKEMPDGSSMALIGDIFQTPYVATLKCNGNVQYKHQDFDSSKQNTSGCVNSGTSK